MSDDPNIISFFCSNRRCGKLLQVVEGEHDGYFTCACGNEQKIPKRKKKLSLFGFRKTKSKELKPSGAPSAGTVMVESGSMDDSSQPAPELSPDARGSAPSRLTAFVDSCGALAERVPTGGVILMWTIIFVGAVFWFTRPGLPVHFGEIVNELTSVNHFFFAPLPNPDGSKVLYASMGEDGMKYTLIDVKTRDKHDLLELSGRNAVPNATDTTYRPLGWSPSGSRIALVQQMGDNPFVEITICDGAAGHYQGSIVPSSGEYREFLWVTDDTVVILDAQSGVHIWKADVYSNWKQAGYLSRTFVAKEFLATEKQSLAGAAVPQNSQSLPVIEISSLARLSDEKFAFAAGGELWSCDVNSLIPVRLSRFPEPMTFKWLRFDERRGAFLFCHTPQNGKKQQLYRYQVPTPRLSSAPGTSAHAAILDRVVAQRRKVGYRSYAPDQRPLLQLSSADQHSTTSEAATTAPDTVGQIEQLSDGFEQTYKGTWLRNGFGYVSKVGGKTRLVIRETDPLNTTNLVFGDGALQSYDISADGAKAFALTSMADEPRGIWQYDLETASASELVESVGTPFQYAKELEPVRYTLERRNGGRIAYYMIPPVDFQRDRKYAIVLDGSGGGRWSYYSQVLANSGIFYVGITSLDLSSRSSREKAADDILAVCEAVRKQPHVDVSRIYLSGFSAGCFPVSRCLDNHPGMWAGIMLCGPPEWARPQLNNTDHPYPPILVSAGDLDQQAEGLDQFAAKARSQGVQIQIAWHENAYHVFRSRRLLRERATLLANFVKR